ELELRSASGNRIAFRSREEAEEYSPGREPWVKMGNGSAPKGRKMRSHSSCHRGGRTTATITVRRIVDADCRALMPRSTSRYPIFLCNASREPGCIPASNYRRAAYWI